MNDTDNSIKSLAAREPAQPTNSEGALTRGAYLPFLRTLEKWDVARTGDRDWLIRTFTFKSYTKALSFLNEVASAAEQANHHPRLTLEWGKVTVAWHTFDVGGLHEIDFILAARVEMISL